MKKRKDAHTSKNKKEQRIVFKVEIGNPPKYIASYVDGQYYGLGIQGFNIKNSLGAILIVCMNAFLEADEDKICDTIFSYRDNLHLKLCTKRKRK